jgi:hypothetical protein
MQRTSRGVTRENGGSNSDYHHPPLQRDRQHYSKNADSDQDKNYASDSWVPSHQSNRRGNEQSSYQSAGSEPRSSPLRGELCFTAEIERPVHDINGISSSRQHRDTRHSLPRSRDIPPLPGTRPRESLLGISTSRGAKSTEVC